VLRVKLLHLLANQLQGCQRLSSTEVTFALGWVKLVHQHISPSEETLYNQQAKYFCVKPPQAGFGGGMSHKQIYVPKHRSGCVSNIDGDVWTPFSQNLQSWVTAIRHQRTWQSECCL